jgi:hypothetical protein
LLLEKVLTSDTVDEFASICPLAVAARPRIAFANLATSLEHWVFLVSTSDGEKFILDPTGEQYGILREHRFLPWAVYKELYVMRGHRPGYPTCKCPASMDQLVEQVETDSILWASLRDILTVTLGQWLAAGEEFDLIQRLKENMGQPRAAAP